MKILWHSNAPHAGTGYSGQTALFTRLLRDDGHDVAISAFWGLQGGVIEWEGIKVYPCGFDGYGNDILPSHAANHFGGSPLDGIVVTLVDVWVLDMGMLSQMNVAAWTPVDHQPVPQGVVRALQGSGALPMAMSRFGERELTAAGLAPTYVPHGVDTDMFCLRDRDEIRKELGFPESAFIVGMVAANKGNPSRKGFPEAIRAFAEFRKKHDDAYLILSTEPNGAVNGINLPVLLSACGVPQEAGMISGPLDHLCAAPAESVAKLMSCFDVFLNPAYGEGFCVPIVEAAACGVPSISTAWTAMPETGDVGWTVEGQEFWTQQSSWWKIPDVEQIVWALGEAYKMAGNLREGARAHALQYDYRTVYREHLLPALESCVPEVVSLEAVA